jgi:hypothetical protein
MSLVWTHKLSVNKQLQQRWLGVIGFLISHKTVVPLRYKVRILFPAASFCSLRTRRPKERVRLSSCLLGFLCVLISVPFQQFCFDWTSFPSAFSFKRPTSFSETLRFQYLFLLHAAVCCLLCWKIIILILEPRKHHCYVNVEACNLAAIKANSPPESASSHCPKSVKQNLLDYLELRSV